MWAPQREKFTSQIKKIIEAACTNGVRMTVTRERLPWVNSNLTPRHAKTDITKT